MVTVGAADVVVCEPEDEPVPLPQAERNRNARSTTHRVKYL
jgi:hypothetical protein